MKKTQFYIIKEILPVFVIGNLLFMMLLLLEKLVTLADLFFAKSVPLLLIIETILYFIPSLFVMTIPLACLLSVLISFSRLSADSELIAMRSIGASNYNLLIPVIFFGIISSLLGILMSTYLAEKGSKLAINNLNKIIENISIKDIREKEMYENIPGIILYINKKNSDTNFDGIIAISRSDGTIISARKGSINPTETKTLEMNFSKGTVTMQTKDEKTTSITFENLLFNMPLSFKITNILNSPMTMSIKELINISSKDNKAAFELSKRFSLPISAILMCLFGFSLGVFLSRSGKSFGVIISIGIAFLYNFLLLYLENIAGKGKIPPHFAAWLPDILFSLLLIYFLRRVFR